VSRRPFSNPGLSEFTRLKTLVIPYPGANSITTPSHTSSEKAEEEFIKTEVAKAAELGIAVIRYPVEWRGIETAKGVRQEMGNRWFRSLKQIVAEAELKGIKILGTVATTPEHASGGSGSKGSNWAPSEPEVSLRPELRSPSGQPLLGSTKGLEELAGYYVPMIKATHEGVREGNGAAKAEVKVALPKRERLRVSTLKESIKTRPSAKPSLRRASARKANPFTTSGAHVLTPKKVISRQKPQANGLLKQRSKTYTNSWKQKKG
jgi:hypothetical protein